MMQTQLQLVFPKTVSGLSHHSKLHLQSFSKDIAKGPVESIKIEKRNCLSVTYFSLAIDEYFIVKG